VIKKQNLCILPEDSLTPLIKMLFNYHSIVVVTGNTSYVTSGAETFIDHELGIPKYERISIFSVNPDYDDLVLLNEKFERSTPDCVIAIGGGTVIDMAKLLLMSYIGGGTEVLLCKKTMDYNRSVHFVAIPTTAGTGSEATQFAVMYRDGSKYSIVHPEMVPDTVVLDYRLTLSLPSYQTACSGFDAFAHALESSWARGSTEESCWYAEKSLSISYQNVQNIVFSPSPKIRKEMLYASYLAGKAINISKTTAAHALSYILTSKYGVPHGHAVAVFLSSVIELNRLFFEENEILHSLGQYSIADFIEWIERLRQSIGLGNLWLKPYDTGEVIRDVLLGVNLQRLKNNFSELDENSLLKVVDKSLNL
jgi:alcohol dehydrogenase